MIFNPLKQGKDARRVFSFNKVYGTNVTQGLPFFKSKMYFVHCGLVESSFDYRPVA